MEAAQHVGKLRCAERGRCSAAEEDRLGLQIEAGAEHLQLAQNRFAKTLRLRRIGAFLVERAVWANARAKWDVHVEVPYGAARTWWLQARRRTFHVRCVLEHHRFHPPNILLFRLLALVFFVAGE